MAFTVLSLLQMAHVLNCKSLNRSIFKVGLFSNGYLVLAIALTLMLQAAVVYVPFLQYAFSTTALNPTDWLLIAFVSILPIAVVEGRKFLFSRAG
jgi:Ca2+-transporting ATPase